MTDRKAKQTPLPDLLDRVPEDIVLGIPGDEPMFPSYTNIPIGRLARQAADELRRLHEAHDWQYRMAGERLRRVEKLEAQRDALLEAAREGLSVCRSVSIRHDRRIMRDGCVLYAQTEKWCRWAEAEVSPKIEAAIKAVEGENHAKKL